MQIKSIAADIEDPDQLINQLRDDLMKHTDEKMESMMAAMMKNRPYRNSDGWCSERRPPIK